MMSSDRQGRGKYMAEINMVPFVDVVLVLLIIFMITAPMLYRGIDIDLPSSATNTIESTERIVITVSKNHTIMVNEKKVKLPDLLGVLGDIQENSPGGATVYLRGDQDVEYGLVVEVMDLIKKAGIVKLGMVTEPVRDRKL